MQHLSFHLLLICLSTSAVYSRHVTPTCQETKDGACGKGQFVSSEEESSCQECPEKTFMSLERHNCWRCTDHTQPDSDQIILRPGNSTSDNLLICRAGFYRVSGFKSGNDGARCQRCTVCGKETWAALQCDRERDTVCCSHGMVVAQDEMGDRFSCVLPSVRIPRKTPGLRKGRSSNTNQESGAQVSGDPHQQPAEPDNATPSNDSLSSTVSTKVDFSTEEKDDDKDEFPVWARILCATVVIGVFLFYMGIGIPCNICGSRDKLRALRKMLQGNEQEISVEASKEKVPEKQKVAGGEQA